MSQFKTLLQREWMQHHRGWLLMMLVPPAVLLLALVFGNVQGLAHVQMDDDNGGATLSGPLMLMFMSTGMVTALVLFITWLAVGFQAPGQARRDQQDRSIEFWLSLPVSNSASIGAMLVMQFLLVPLLALGLGWLCAQLIGMVAVARVEGVGAWFSLPWDVLLPASLALLLRVALGIVLATLWVLPLLLLSMVASAWLKRWGVPAVVAAIGGGGLVLHKLYGVSWPFDVVRELSQHAGRALIYAEKGLNVQGDSDFLALLGDLPRLLAGDFMSALRDCAQPLFLGALLFSAACFALLVLRRRRGA
jgi:ABC-2 type transport system permease protein